MCRFLERTPPHCISLTDTVKFDADEIFPSSVDRFNRDGGDAVAVFGASSPGGGRKLSGRTALERNARVGLGERLFGQKLKDVGGIMPIARVVKEGFGEDVAGFINDRGWLGGKSVAHLQPDLIENPA
jgi:hypothetical protein